MLRTAPALLLLVAAACGDSAPPDDAGASDVGRDSGLPNPDASRPDGAQPDGAVPDAALDGGTNLAPIVSIAPVSNISLPTSSLALDGDVTDDGLPPGSVLNTNWTVDSGPSGASFADASAVDTTVHFTSPGLYTLRLSASDGELSGEATVDVRVHSHPGDLGPVVVGQIGPITINLGTTLTMTLQKATVDGTAEFLALPLPLMPHLSLHRVTGNVRFIPNLAQVGSHEVTFIAADDSGQDSETVTITVLGPNAGDMPAVRGRVVEAVEAAMGNVVPLEGVTIRSPEAGISVTTGPDGWFELRGVPTGVSHVDYDGTTATVGAYAGYRARIDLESNYRLEVARPVYLMAVDPTGQAQVNPGQSTAVNNPSIGVSMTIPPDAVKDQNGADFTGMISISEVPVDFAPGAMPEEFRPAQLITVQPMGLRFDTPVPVTFPNLDNLAPGSEVELWSLNHETGSFFISGRGAVSQDGATIETLSGGLREVSWHGVRSAVSTTGGELKEALRKCLGEPALEPEAADDDGSVELVMRLPGSGAPGREAPRLLVFGSQRAAPRPVVKSTIVNPIRSAVPGTVSTSLRVGGVIQGAETFTDTSGFDEQLDEAFEQKAAFDARLYPSGAYPSTLEHRSHFGLQSAGFRTGGTIVVNNLSGSPFGCGWNLADLHRLVEMPDGTVVVFPGRGRGAHFTRRVDVGSPTDIADTNNARGVRSVDIDRDGDLDLVELFGGGIRIHESQGGRGLSLLETINLTPPPEALEVLDVDRDGSPDIVTTAQSPSMIRVLRNDGLGNFSETNHGVYNSATQEIIAADLNGDGILDLAVRNGSNITALLGDGLGAYTESWTSPLGFGPAEIDVGDANGDGIADLFVYGNFGARALGNGDGTFQAPVNIISEPQALNAGASADLNGDGYADHVVVFQFGASGMQVHYGDASGGAGDGTFFPVGDFAADAKSVELVDFDGNGILDAVVTLNSDKVAIFTGDGSGFFEATPVEFPAGLQAAGGRQPVRTVTADADGDGALDIAVLASGGLVTILYGDSTSSNELVAPPGEFSTLVRNVDGTFTQTLRSRRTLDFDANGRLTSSTNRSGDATLYEYDAAGRLDRIVDTGNAETLITYDGSGHVDSITTPGGTLDVDVDAQGQVTRAVDDLGNVRSFTWGADCRPASVTDPRGNTTRINYGRLGRVSSIDYADGATRGIAPAALSGLLDPAQDTSASPGAVVRPGEILARITDGAGEVTTVEFGDEGGAVRIVDPLMNEVQIARDNNGTGCGLTDALGARFTARHDNMANPVELTMGVGDALERRVENVSDSALNRITQHTNFAGDVFTYGYDASGNLTNVSGPEGLDESWTFDANGWIATHTDSRNNTTSYTRDARGNVLTRTAADGTVTRLTRDAAGRPLTINEADGTAEARTTTYTYDALGRVTSRTTPGGRTTLYEYDAASNLTRIQLPSGSERVRTYDSRNRLSSIDGGPDGLVTLGYDTRGNVVSVTNALGAATGFVYDAANRLSAVSYPDGGQLLYVYDANGAPQSVTDSNNRTTTFVRDIFGRVMSVTDAKNQTRTYTYDSRDNLASVEAPGVPLKTYTYDGLSRLTGITSGASAVGYGYDPASNLTSSSNNDTTITRVFDPQNRLVSETTSFPGAGLSTTLVRTRNTLGEITGCSLGARDTTYTLDADGQLAGIVTQAGQTITLTRDPSGLLTSVAYPSGATTTRTHDANDRLVSVVHRDPAMTPIEQETLTLDAAGRTTSVTDLSGTTNQSYDAVGRVLQDGVDMYTYDLAGNRTSSPQSASYVLNAADEIIEDDNFFYTYVNRRLTSRTAKVGGAVTSYTWNELDQLTRVDLPSGSVVQNTYSAAGLRIEEDVDGNVTRFVYNGVELVGELDGSNAVVREHTPLSTVAGGQSYYHHFDAVGSQRAMTDATGAVVSFADIDRFYGVERSRTETVPAPYGFSGGERDVETGLVYKNGEWYLAELGRPLVDTRAVAPEYTPTQVVHSTLTSDERREAIRVLDWFNAAPGSETPSAAAHPTIQALLDREARRLGGGGVIEQALQREAARAGELGAFETPPDYVPTQSALSNLSTAERKEVRTALAWASGIARQTSAGSDPTPVPTETQRRRRAVAPGEIARQYEEQVKVRISDWFIGLFFVCPEEKYKYYSPDSDHWRQPPPLVRNEDLDDAIGESDPVTLIQ